MAAEIQDGAVVVARAILNSSLWTMPNTCRILAITGIALACWKPRRWWNGSKEIELQRGQLARSWDGLSVAAKLTVKEVRRASEHLEHVDFWVRTRAKRYSIFTIPKYDFYQDLSNYSDSTAPDVGRKSGSEGAASGQRGGNVQEGKKERTVLQTTAEGASAVETVEKPLKAVENQEPAAFVRFWSTYPACYRKQGRAEALRAWFKLSPSDELAGAMLEVLKEHAKSREWAKEDGRFIPKPANWLTSRAWEGSAEVLAARMIGEQQKRQRTKEERAARLADANRIEKETAELAANPERWKESQDKLRKAAAGLTGPVKAAVMKTLAENDVKRNGK